MDNSEIQGKPKAVAGDIAHLIVKAGLSAIPYIGGPAAEIFSSVITPSLTKRRDKWVESIYNALRELEKRVEGFKIENLSNNEIFITTLMHASQAAIRNHQDMKIDALRNAVLNAALPNVPEEDIQLMFLNFIDSLTPWHLRILILFDNPEDWARNNGKEFPVWQFGTLFLLIGFSHEELRNRREFCDQIIRDLYSMGLINIDNKSLHTTISGPGLLASHTTKFGKDFIRFITSPLV